MGIEMGGNGNHGEMGMGMKCCAVMGTGENWNGNDLMGMRGIGNSKSHSRTPPITTLRFNCDSTVFRLSVDCLSKVIKVTVT